MSAPENVKWVTEYDDDGEPMHATSFTLTSEGLVIDTWNANEDGHAIGEEPTHTGYLTEEDLVELARKVTH